tara:strand:- start:3064 stop:3576 length:513 start_codon:yes stop_codon:yes gene_type:complete
MNASQRRKELKALARYRITNKLGLGEDAGWAHVIGNMLRVLMGQVTAATIQSEARAYGLPPLCSSAVDDVADQIGGRAWGTPKLYKPAHAGSLLSLTSIERSEAGIQKIEASDEDIEARRLRLDRERKARKRAAKAALAPRKKSKAELARELGVSRRTLYRMIESGKLEP